MALLDIDGDEKIAKAEYQAWGLRNYLRRDIMRLRMDGSIWVYGWKDIWVCLRRPMLMEMGFEYYGGLGSGFLLV